MDNEALKQVFEKLNAKIIREVDPDSAIDELFAKNVITDGDYDELSNAKGRKDRCRELLALLHRSSHPETFIQLRLALLADYPQIVNEVDEELKSQPAQPQQPHMSQDPEGNVIIIPCCCCYSSVNFWQ